MSKFIIVNDKLNIGRILLHMDQIVYARDLFNRSGEFVNSEILVKDTLLESSDHASEINSLIYKQEMS